MKTLKFVSETELSKICQIPVRTLQNWRLHQKLLPYHKVGHLVRYNLDEVLEIFASNTVQPVNVDNREVK